MMEMNGEAELLLEWTVKPNYYWTEWWSRVIIEMNGEAELLLIIEFRIIVTSE